MKAISNDIEEKPLPNNLTDIYEKLLSNITKSCLTKEDYMELYGNKSPYGIVYSFAHWLINEASKQIGLNELRRYFHLKPQQIFSNITAEEIPEKEGFIFLEEFNKTINYFKEKHKNFGEPTIFGQFWPEEIDVAEKFLDRKFPEIRKMYKIGFEKNMNNGKKLFNKAGIDIMFHQLKVTRSKIMNAIIEVNADSFSTLRSGRQTGNC